MSQQTTGSLIFRALKALVLAILSLAFIVLAFSFKLLGLFFTTVSTAMEKMNLKHLS